MPVTNIFSFSYILLYSQHLLSQILRDVEKNSRQPHFKVIIQPSEVRAWLKCISRIRKGGRLKPSRIAEKCLFHVQLFLGMGSISYISNRLLGCFFDRVFERKHQHLSEFFKSSFYDE